MFPVGPGHVVNMQVERNGNANLELNIVAGADIVVRVQGAAERRRELTQRVQDLLTLPVFTGMAFGFYEIAKILAAQSGIDLTTTLSILTGVLTSTGILYTSEAARNVTQRTLNLIGRVTSFTAMSVTHATRRFFEMIGNGTAMAAMQFPALIGMLVAGSAVHAANQSGLSTYTAALASYAAEEIPQLAASFSSALLEFVNSNSTNTTQSELLSNVTEQLSNLTSAVWEFANSDLNTTYPEL